ncbi:hypothetical protein Bca101_040373 [Brassica carinata]
MVEKLDYRSLMDDFAGKMQEDLYFSNKEKIWISERVYFVFCRKESTGRLMSFFIDSPDSHRLITPGCRASTLETSGLFSTMFVGTITSKSLWLSDDLV